MKVSLEGSRALRNGAAGSAASKVALSLDPDRFERLTRVSGKRACTPPLACAREPTPASVLGAAMVEALWRRPELDDLWRDLPSASASVWGAALADYSSAGELIEALAGASQQDRAALGREVRQWATVARALEQLAEPAPSKKPLLSEELGAQAKAWSLAGEGAPGDHANRQLAAKRFVGGLGRELKHALGDAGARRVIKRLGLPHGCPSISELTSGGYIEPAGSHELLRQAMCAWRERAGIEAMALAADPLRRALVADPSCRGWSAALDGDTPVSRWLGVQLAAVALDAKPGEDALHLAARLRKAGAIERARERLRSLPGIAGAVRNLAQALERAEVASVAGYQLPPLPATWALPLEVQEKMEAHLLGVFPEEGGGFLVSASGQWLFLPIRNLWSGQDQAFNTFEADAAVQGRLAKLMDHFGLLPLAFVHSHCRGAPTPSGDDAQSFRRLSAVRRGLRMWIVGLDEDEGGFRSEHAAYLVSPDGRVGEREVVLTQ